jgi:hypothetical protein
MKVAKTLRRKGVHQASIPKGGSKGGLIKPPPKPRAVSKAAPKYGAFPRGLVC